MTTVSPDSIVSTGLVAALKFPMFTVCGLGISVYSAAGAPQMPALHAMAAPASCARVRGMVFIPSLAMNSSPRVVIAKLDRARPAPFPLFSGGRKPLN
jgi:hypothetical protein